MEGSVESNIKSNLRVFKDKKLDRLWEKAKAASGTSGKGMSDEELAVLKREFQHYQGKKQAWSYVGEPKSPGGGLLTFL